MHQKIEGGAIGLRWTEKQQFYHKHSKKIPVTNKCRYNIYSHGQHSKRSSELVLLT